MTSKKPILFYICFSAHHAPSAKRPTLKQKNKKKKKKKKKAPKGDYFFPFRVGPFSDGMQNNLEDLPSLKVHQYILIFTWWIKKSADDMRFNKKKNLQKIRFDISFKLSPTRQISYIRLVCYCKTNATYYVVCPFSHESVKRQCQYLQTTLILCPT